MNHSRERVLQCVDVLASGLRSIWWTNCADILDYSDHTGLRERCVKMSFESSETLMHKTTHTDMLDSLSGL